MIFHLICKELPIVLIFLGINNNLRYKLWYIVYNIYYSEIKNVISNHKDICVS